ncbi:MAG: Mini-ribonuclease 3 [Bacilli bacterium]|jgi:ribonuclease-3 family protein|nr:Mini-ribonuclease 3 [Bacilli bacterium]
MRNGKVLAFIGDSVWELKIREYFVLNSKLKVNDLQSMTSKFASAKAHLTFIKYLLANNLLNEEEINIYKKGRNTKVNEKRKNFNSEAYHASTGFEALIGYLYLSDNKARIDTLMDMIIKEFN